MHDAVKVVIITERILLDRVAALIDKAGATGYTHTEAGGKGSRGVRNADRGYASGLSVNIKVETIASDQKMAEAIVDAVVSELFEDYAGICYVVPVGILRPEKFSNLTGGG